VRRWWRGWIVVWCAALATVPVPYTGVEDGWVPAVWLLVIAVVAAAIGLAEGGLVPWQFAAVLGSQALLAAAVLALGARVLVPRLEALAPDRASWVLGSLLAILAMVAACDVYRSPIVAIRWTNLVGIWG
jgi:hypothetical protein